MIDGLPRTLKVLQAPRLIFLGQWLRHPRSVASVTPSGRELTRLMVSAIPRGAGRVVELGAGTGTITQALLQRGIRPHELAVVELNPVLHGLLQKRFPNSHVICGDARDLAAMLEPIDSFAGQPVDAVCSSLGLLPMSSDLQHGILEAAFDVLGADGIFVQYTYGLKNPVDEQVLRDLRLRYKLLGRAWHNLPPAQVFIYSREG